MRAFFLAYGREEVISAQAVPKLPAPKVTRLVDKWCRFRNQSQKRIPLECQANVC